MMLFRFIDELAGGAHDASGINEVFQLDATEQIDSFP